MFNTIFCSGIFAKNIIRDNEHTLFVGLHRVSGSPVFGGDSHHIEFVVIWRRRSIFIICGGLFVRGRSFCHVATEFRFLLRFTWLCNFCVLEVNVEGCLWYIRPLSSDGQAAWLSYYQPVRRMEVKQAQEGEPG